MLKFGKDIYLLGATVVVGATVGATVVDKRSVVVDTAVVVAPVVVVPAVVVELAAAIKKKNKSIQNILKISKFLTCRSRCADTGSHSSQISTFK